MSARKRRAVRHGPPAPERPVATLTPRQAAEQLGVHRQTVYRYIRDGKLLASQLRGRYRLSQRHVAFLQWERQRGKDGAADHFSSRAELIVALQADPLDEEALQLAEQLARQGGD